jgi:hypothetical protein
MLALSFLSAAISKVQHPTLTQPFIQTIKYRNLVLDLGNGIKTKAQLCLEIYMVVDTLYHHLLKYRVFNIF